MPDLNQSIFSKIGGIDALHDVVDTFYDRVLADPDVNEFFIGTNMDVQRGKMKAFLMMALGGPVQFTGKEIRHAHTHLVDNGLTDHHFDVVGKHLLATLEHFNVETAIREEIKVVLESVRSAVLNK